MSMSYLCRNFSDSLADATFRYESSPKVKPLKSFGELTSLSAYTYHICRDDPVSVIWKFPACGQNWLYLKIHKSSALNWNWNVLHSYLMLKNQYAINAPDETTSKSIQLSKTSKKKFKYCCRIGMYLYNI